MSNDGMAEGPRPDPEAATGLSDVELSHWHALQVIRIVRLASRISAKRRTIAPLSEAAARAAAKRIYQLRRERNQFFNQFMFGEPVWDMLLMLFCWDERSRALRIKDLSLGAGIPATTALRWVERMKAEGMIEKYSHPTDGRVVEIKLTSWARQSLHQYFSKLHALDIWRPSWIE